MTHGYFIIDNDTNRAVAHFPTYEAAKVAHDAIEPVASRPDRPWPQMWRYMIEAERGPNDCRTDLYEQTLTYFSQLKDNPPCATTDAPTTAPRDETRQQLAIRLRLASPKRADAGRYLAPQDDASDCPLFRATNEPTLL